jgi:hypothetical protein
MTEPTLIAIAERLRARTAALAPDDDAYGWAHALLCGALGQAMAQVADIWDPEDPIPPGAPLLDVDLCPDWALPWLAQIVGVVVPSGATVDQARTLIRDVAGWKRGSPDALYSAASATLTGTKTVYFRERNGGDPYALEVVTLTGETPDTSVVLASLMAQKPGGIALTYRTVTYWDWAAVKAGVTTWTALKTTYTTWQGVATKTPGT